MCCFPGISVVHFFLLLDNSINVFLPLKDIRVVCLLTVTNKKLLIISAFLFKPLFGYIHFSLGCISRNGISGL